MVYDPCQTEKGCIPTFVACNTVPVVCVGLTSNAVKPETPSFGVVGLSRSGRGRAAKKGTERTRNGRAQV